MSEVREVTFIGGPLDGKVISRDNRLNIVVPAVNTEPGPMFVLHRYDGATGAYIGIDEPRTYVPYVEPEPSRGLALLRERLRDAYDVFRHGRD